MPNSPLDGSFESSKKRSKPKWILAIIALIGTVVGGGVFAATILINNDEDIEFGQGVSGVIACDGDGVTLTPIAGFDGTSFALTEVRLSNLADACGGKILTVGVYATGEATPLEEWETTGASPAADFTFASTSSPSAESIYNITIESN